MKDNWHRGETERSSTFFTHFCVPEVTKITVMLFFEGIDLSDFFSFALVLLWISSTNG